jgi:hypothetical protein
MIYMSRTKLVMVSLLVTFALSAVSSPTVSAHEFIVNGKGVAAGEKVEFGGNWQQQQQQQIEIVVAKLSAHMHCQMVIIPIGTTNVLEEKGKMKVKIEFKACTVYTLSGEIIENQPKCKIKEFTAEGSGELTEAGMITVKGAPFATIHIEEVTGAGACTLAGEFKIEGTQLCPISHYAVGVIVIIITCNPAGSKELKLGGEPAKLYLPLVASGSKGQRISSN